MSIQRIRDNSQSLISKIIVGLIVLTFAVFGLESIRGGSDASGVASVNGTEITNSELARASERVKNRLLSLMGEDGDPNLVDEAQVKNEALKELIRRQLMLQDADEQGLFVSDKQIDKNIVDTPAFQVSGVFDRQTYETLLRNVGYRPSDYKTELGNDLKLQQLLLGISQSAFSTRMEIDQAIRLDRQGRDIAYMTVVAGDLASAENITAADVEKWYQAHQDQYLTEESVRIQYLELRRSDFVDQVEVSDAELDQQYQQEVEGLKLRQERRAAHILVSVDDRSDAAALDKIREVQAKLVAGGDFATLATEYSDDPGSAEIGGDLGYTEKGAFPKPFEEALFSLEIGQLSDIVETDFGYQIIKLLDIRDLQAPSFDEIRDQLADDIKYRKAEELFVTAEEELSNDSFSAGDLEEPAENLGLVVQETDFFSRAGGSDVISADPKIRRTAFSKEVLEGMNSELITLAPDHIVVIRLKEHKPAAILPLAQVTDEIRDHLIQALARQKAEQKAQQMVVELRDGATPTQITQTYNYQWTIVDKVKRNQQDLDPEIIRKVFQMPTPDLGGKTISSLTQDNGDALVIILTRVYDGEVGDLNDQEIKPLYQLLANQTGSFEYLEYQSMLNDIADIEIY